MDEAAAKLMELAKRGAAKPQQSFPYVTTIHMVLRQYSYFCSLVKQVNRAYICTKCHTQALSSA